MASNAARILISSTSEDLKEHRQRLLDTLGRMQQNGIGMELFGARPNAPVEECQREVEQADLIVLILAHRYGWVPSTAEGGDGKTSITRMEFNRAVLARKPVLAFIVADKAEWHATREQDGLLQATSLEDAGRVFERVQALKEFKAEVSKLVRDTFTTPADLADRAGSSVANWLLQRKAAAETSAAADSALQDLMKRVTDSLEKGEDLVALTHLKNASKTFAPAYLPMIVDKRLEIAAARLSLLDEQLEAAALAVREHAGKRQDLAFLVLGKVQSQTAVLHWKRGEREGAWLLASQARSFLEDATKVDPCNPDAFGSLGGNLKRMAQWARELHPEQVPALEDAMLAAYRSGWEHTPDAYPLLNYVEQRALLAQQRDPIQTGNRVLIGKDEHPLRRALGLAVKAREAQLLKQQDRPWAAFDVARARHYLRPNLAGFLEDLAAAVEDARSMARVPEDRYMVTTTVASLRSLVQANVKLDGLQEGIELLEQAVAEDSWYYERPRRPTHYLENELMQLQAAVIELGEQNLNLAARNNSELAGFVKATQLRWSRDDEERFQEEIVQWKEDLEPTELKIARGLWKIFGAKALKALAGSIPVDWDEALKLTRSLLDK